MAIDEYRFLIRGRIPVLKMHGEPRPRPAVVVLHGLGSSADVQRPELVSLAEAGFSAVGVDAPHHGARRDQWVEQTESMHDAATHERFLRHLLEAIPEVSQVIDHLVQEGHWPIGVLGISMGAYTALGVAQADHRIVTTISILGSPDWSPTHGDVNDTLRALMREAPVHDPLAVARAPLLLLNAGLDTVVPPSAAREFAANLRGRRTVEYLEYPESDHLMRPDDWADLWQRVLGFLRTHLRD